MGIVRLLEAALGEKARLNFLPMQVGAVPVTHADLNRLCEISHSVPRISVKEGVRCFVDKNFDFYGKKIFREVFCLKI